ncbi:DUF4331 family protein [Sphingomonas sp. 28-63-12]|uniref:DUF4331 family protein n=1 Tax=Sphingomonas sp. 28-63-12 TaxID=1970434 RepID=UPI0035A8A6D2
MKFHRRLLACAAPLALASVLSGCSGGDSAPIRIVSASPTPSPSPAPAPTPSPTPAALNAQPCLDQVLPGTSTTVASLIFPDTLTLDFATPSGFPNGRRLTDQVIDITLGVLLLKLSSNNPGALALLPLGPPANEVPFRSTFPYLAPANGTPILAGTAGTNFNFRTDPASAYTRVDRMGMPAVATVLAVSARKVPYNDANPSDDAANLFRPDLQLHLGELADEFQDDIRALRLTPCAV